MVASAINQFGLTLYRRLANRGGNLFFSPFSLFSALAAVLEGAGGETALEMGEVLGLPEKWRRVSDPRCPWHREKIQPEIKGLQDALCRRDPAEKARLEQEIAALRVGLADVQSALAAAQEKDDWQELAARSTRESEIVVRLNRALEAVDTYEFQTANALWAEKTYPFREAFLQRMAATGRDLFTADFRNDYETERQRINRWTADRTAGRIRDLLGPLSAEEAGLLTLVVVNAIWFKGNWRGPFPATETARRPFAVAGGAPVGVEMMRADNYSGARYAAFRSDGAFFDTPTEIRRGQTEGLYPGPGGFFLLELPYKGDRPAMVVIVPADPGGLEAIEGRLSADHLAGWIEQLRPRAVHVRLPKFRLETDYELKAALQGQGMARAFVNPLEPGGADFKAMSASEDPRLQLYITHVLHKAFVEVNETGTEAAAATAVLMALAAGIPDAERVPFIPRFEADRPFLFLIRDRVGGTLLFLGRVAAP